MIVSTHPPSFPHSSWVTLMSNMRAIATVVPNPKVNVAVSPSFAPRSTYTSKKKQLKLNLGKNISLLLCCPVFRPHMVGVVLPDDEVCKNMFYVKALFLRNYNG